MIHLRGAPLIPATCALRSRCVVSFFSSCTVCNIPGGKLCCAFRLVHELFGSALVAEVSSGEYRRRSSLGNSHIVQEVTQRDIVAHHYMTCLGCVVNSSRLCQTRSRILVVVLTEKTYPSDPSSESLGGGHTIAEAFIHGRKRSAPRCRRDNSEKTPYRRGPDIVLLYTELGPRMA